MIDGLSFGEASDRFGWNLAACIAKVQLMRKNGLWLKEDGTLSKCTLSREQVSCQYNDGAPH